MVMVGTECLESSDGLCMYVWGVLELNVWCYQMGLYICGVCVGTECLVSPDGSLYVCLGCVLGLNVWCHQMGLCMYVWGVCWN